nr:M56 family metallopeptidase [uncultured Sphingomonas sp.]
MSDWLLDTLLATSALMLLVLLIRQPVRQHFGSRVAYALWLLPAGRALMPALSKTVVRPAPNPISDDIFHPAISAEPRLLPNITAPSASLVDALGGWPTIAVAVWFAVALGLLARGFGDYRRQRIEILTGGVALARIGAIRLVRSNAVRGPVAFGLIDRVIAVPADFDRRFGDRERRLALDHEIAHHRHGDLFANSFAFVLLSLQWFNPLAWWSYAAFRFDQEAACDARVLDKACPGDRADYGRAIAKAASGRALLLASALDQRKTLHRRLQSMLTTTSNRRRTIGTVTILLAAAIALPLTATRAITYVDANSQALPASAAAPARAAAAAVPAAPTSLATPVTWAPPTAAVAVPAAAQVATHISHNDDGTVWIKGKRMKLEDMTPEERNELRRELGEARAQMAKGQAEAMADIARARQEIERETGMSGREMVNARAEIEMALREVDAHAADIRKAGQDPDVMKETIRASLSRVAAIDVAKIKRDALASIDENVIQDSMRKAEQSISAMEAELDRLDRK